MEYTKKGFNIMIKIKSNLFMEGKSCCFSPVNEINFV